MELTVLGTGGGWAMANGAACGYLLQHDGFNLWVDAGTGTLANLQAHVAIPDVDAVVISHRHFDHFLDLYPYFLARYYPVPDRLPKEWVQPRAFGNVLSFVDTRFSEENLGERLRLLLGPVRAIDTQSMPLDSVFKTLARAARDGAMP